MLYKISLPAQSFSTSSRDPIPENIDDLDLKNIRLALNFQGQGKLDAAYALFKQCKSSDKVVRLLTNLAQDYEIINQHDNAKKVYTHILILDSNNAFAASKVPEKIKKAAPKPVKKTEITESSLFNEASASS